MKTAHRNESRAKRYQADPLAMFRVFGRVSPFTEEEQRLMNMPVRIAYDLMLHRKGEEADFHTLAAAVNVAMVCSEKIGLLAEETCILARDAMKRVWDRHAKTGEWGFDGPAIVELDLAINIYEQLTANLTGGQLKDAMSECIRRMQAGEVLEVES